MKVKAQSLYNVVVILYDIVYECPHIKAAATASRPSSERGLPGWPLLPFASKAG